MTMKCFLLIVYLCTPNVALRVGYIKNVTLEGLPANLWINQTNDCDCCLCLMFTRNYSAFNCYSNGLNQSSCLMFENYPNNISTMRLAPGMNGSSVYFNRFPPQLTNVPSTTNGYLQMTTQRVPCAGFVQSTILLQLQNIPTQSYVYYSFIYQASTSKVTLMFCFLNQQYFWALDSVSMKDTVTNNELLSNGGFDQGGWTPWEHHTTGYIGSGMRTSHNSVYSYAGSQFYYDVQYTFGDGIFQNVTTISGRNYNISFYLANPYGGNVSLAIVSIGP